MKCVVFDVDGVLLGEEQYFNASALAVWEILYSRDYMGLPTEQDDFVPSRVSAGQIAYIRNRVWGEDRLLSWLYRHNAESMWDMSHLCMLGILWSMAREYKQRTGGADWLSFSIHKPEDFRALGMQVMGLHVPLAEQIVQLFKTVIPEQVMGNDIFDLLKKEMEKLTKNLGGIKEMKKLPDAIFIVDPKKERICVQEAQALGIKLIGIVDTNCDPDELDYVIPGNDDAIRAVKLIVSKMADAVIEANQGVEEAPAEEAEAVEEA